ncbi:chemotaxis protein CheW [Pseudoroseomonas cervicalis]|uniref:chemotaxis protein CheW n=1 Tax=Teichococcus cervicalis TaxID=204525 RepID=UPI0022F15CAC|nr:chemotaxis protein CheW [Pseudoroseomonas cervicalis]WBV45367.1 chemotaxis protein CheW [Pseudoroseomonas cervicalis]
MRLAAAGEKGPEAYLLFRLGSRRCALPRAAVQEVLPLPRLWRPPGLPRVMAGFLNLGGVALPVLDLARLFGLQDGAAAEQALYRHILLLPGSAGGALGLLVDRVLDLQRVAQDRLRAVPPEATLNGCAVAEIETPEGFVHLLDPARILLAQEAAALAALRDSAESRLAEWSGPPA